jgi:hypothetical protein
MSINRYHWLDAVNDLASLFGQRWVAIPLIGLLVFKVISLEPASAWYLPPLLLLTLLLAIRLTATLVLRNQKLLAQLVAEQRRRQHNT